MTPAATGQPRLRAVGPAARYSRSSGPGMMSAGIRGAGTAREPRAAGTVRCAAQSPGPGGQATEERGEDGQEARGRAYRRAVALPITWGGSGDLAALRACQDDPRGTIEDASWADLSSADLLNLSLLGSGSLNGVMVGGEGFEPPTSSMSSWRSPD